MFPILFEVQHVRYVADGVDEMGDPVEGYADPVPVGVWFFDPGGSDEPVIPGHDRTVTSPTLYGPYGLPFRAKDKCVVDGVTYMVDGHARPWIFPGSGVHGSVVKLEFVEG